MARRRPIIALVAFGIFCTVLASCGQDKVQPAPPPTFEGTAPTVPPLTAGEIAELVRQLEDPLGTGPPAQEISASAFALGSAQPDVGNPDWRTFIAKYGDPQVREAAVRFGWIIHVTGFTDSTGTAAVNGPLSEARASAAKQALVLLGYPDTSVMALRGGVGGSDPSNRRIVVQFVRKSP